MLAKYGMTLAALGFAAELRGDGIASNARWPRTLIADRRGAQSLGSEAAMARARTRRSWAASPMRSSAAARMEQTGQALIDDEVLAAAGADDLSPYRHGKGEL